MIFINNPKVSVIIPVYNVEKYISNSLDSVINQTLNDIEIICINDGSTDNSLNILNKYAQNDGRIKVITQSHQGVSASRNRGIEIAKADYIYFIDSDDYISSDYLQIMYEAIIQSNADIVVNDNIIEFYDSTNKKTKQYLKKKFDNGIYNITHQLILDKLENISVWAKLYKKDLIVSNNLSFPKGFIYEDVYFYYAIMPYTKTLVQINAGNYYYRRRKNSIIHQKNKISDCIDIFELIYNFYKERGLLNTYILPYYIMGYRSTQVSNYAKYHKKLLKIIDKFKLDTNKFNDKKLFCLYKSPNLFIYRINKIILDLTIFFQRLKNNLRKYAA